MAKNQSKPATKNAAAKTSTKPRQALLESSTSNVPDPAHAKVEQTLVEEELVTVDVPKAFTLTLDDGTPKPIRAGVQKLPVSMATHWFSVNMGVKPYEVAVLPDEA